MTRLAPVHPALQERSRRTLDRLLDAAETMLAEHGLDGATVPAIAKRAGLSVGVVYRRFPDKDALLRGVYERFFDRSYETSRNGLAQAKASNLSTPRLLSAIVKGMVRGYSLKRDVVRALLLYWLTHPDPRFRRLARSHNQRTMALIDELFAPRYAEIEHPEARQALRLALFTVAGISELLVLDESDDDFPFAQEPDRLASEFARLCLRYLGFDETEIGAAPPRAGRARRTTRAAAATSAATKRASGRSPRPRRRPTPKARRA